ncbi:MAG TPA: M14 metallopeptidase family protein [Vicinamibacterales bacterium]|nr:M14 metallopeptidase family protein [Vicinamibacterales bacterium]
MHARARLTVLWFSFAAAGILAGAAPSAQRTSVPTPQSVLGWEPCADYKLATYEQIEDYFRKLAGASPERMRLVEMGKTAEGRTQVLGIVSSEANIRQLNKYQDIARKLALGKEGERRLTDDEARALAREGKAVVWIDFGLHSTEVAHGQTAPVMVYKAVTDESEEMKTIRDNVIFLLVANMNPDGTTMVASWYRENLGKPWEMRLPELWHKYVGHDDNRDWYMMNQPETRNSARQLYFEWFPQIIYNQHQSGPFPSRIFVPPFDDPMNPNIPPLVMRGVNTIGDAMTRRLDQEGKRGAVSRIGFDTWWNGGMRTAPYFHNMIGILTETGHSTATPANYDPSTFPKYFAGTTIPTLQPTTYYPSPYLGGAWHLRDSCNIMVTTSMAVLDIAAKRKQEFLYDIYQMGREAVRNNADETFVVPAQQWDPPTAVKLINVLRLGGIEVERATAPFSAGGKQYDAGSFVIRGAQPFEPYVRDLLTPQVYPDMRLYPGGPPKRPYDITGWTLNYQMGVAVDRVMERVNVATEKVDVAQPPRAAPSIDGPGNYLVIDPRLNDSFAAVNRLLKDRVRVFRSTDGTFLISRDSRFDPSRIVSLGVSLNPGPATLPADAVEVRGPRIGLYHAWGGNMDEGWTRWLLEQFEFPYSSVFDRDVRTGNLRARFDVILLPDATYESMLNGLAPGSMPEAYTGGMTARGVANLLQFVRNGGTLVAMDRAAGLPLAAFDLPIRNVTDGLNQSDFYIPGSILKLKVNAANPIAYGMPAEAAAFFINSPAFAIDGNPAHVHVVAEYPNRDLLMSGWMLGEKTIAGRAAVIEATVDQGRVILLGFRTQHRGQMHGAYKLLFNSMLLSTSSAPPIR